VQRPTNRLGDFSSSQVLGYIRNNIECKLACGACRLGSLGGCLMTRSALRRSAPEICAARRIRAERHIFPTGFPPLPAKLPQGQYIAPHTKYHTEGPLQKYRVPNKLRQNNSVLAVHLQSSPCADASPHSQRYSIDA